LVGVHPVFSPNKQQIYIPTNSGVSASQKNKDLLELGSISPMTQVIGLLGHMGSGNKYYKRMTFYLVIVAESLNSFIQIS